MATKEVDVKELVTKRIVKVDKALDSMVVGSKEHVLAVGDLKKLADAWSTMEEKRISEEDNVAKREEQKRMNDNEIEQKKFEAVMSQKRYEADMVYKTNQNRITLGQVAMQALINSVGLGAQIGMTKMACTQEYGLTNGESFTPPRNVANELNGLSWFWKNKKM